MLVGWFSWFYVDVQGFRCWCWFRGLFTPNFLLMFGWMRGIVVAAVVLYGRVLGWWFAQKMVCWYFLKYCNQSILSKFRPHPSNIQKLSSVKLLKLLPSYHLFSFLPWLCCFPESEVFLPWFWWHNAQCAGASWMLLWQASTSVPHLQVLHMVCTSCIELYSSAQSNTRKAEIHQKFMGWCNAAYSNPPADSATLERFSRMCLEYANGLPWAQ